MKQLEVAALVLIENNRVFLLPSGRTKDLLEACGSSLEGNWK